MIIVIFVEKTILIEFIRKSILLEAKKSKTKRLRLRAQNKSDLTYAIGWLRLNKLLGSAGKASTASNGQHQITISYKGDRKKVVDTIKNRFGSFVNVS